MTHIVSTPDSAGAGLTAAGDTLLVTSQGSILDDVAPSSGIGTAISATGNNETVTLDGSVYCAYTSSSDTVEGDGVYLDGSEDTLTVDSILQGGSAAAQDNGDSDSIFVGSSGMLQGLGFSSDGFLIQGSGSVTTEDLQNLGTITGTVGIAVVAGGLDTIVNGGTISGGIGNGYEGNVALEYIENSGAISGSGVAIQSKESTSGIDLVNTGLLTSGAQDPSENNGTIYLDDASGATSWIDNEGTIIGTSSDTGLAINSSTDDLDLTNSGTIHGTVYVANTADIRNSGTITGDAVAGSNSSIIVTGAGIIDRQVSVGDDGEVSVVAGGTVGAIALTGTSAAIDDSRGNIGLITLDASDVIDYQGLFGEQVVTNFIGGSGSTHDTLSFAVNDFGSFTAMSKDMTQVGADTVIKRDSDDSITLVGVTKTTLVAADFAFT